MHNLISYNQLAGWNNNHPEVETETNDAINDYFQCLGECDDNESVCKRICLETHL